MTLSSTPNERRHRLRVAFLTPLPTPYRQPLLERLAASPDWDMTVYYLAAAEVDRSWDVPIPKDNPRFRVLPGKSIAFMGKRSFINHWNPGLWRELDAGGYDLVVIPGYALLSSQSAILWARIRRKPYVIHSESHLVEPRSWWRKTMKSVLVRSVVSHARGCLATGSLSKAHLCHYGARSDRVFFFPNTPDVEWFIRRSDELRPQRDALRKEWGIPDGPAVVFVGRLIHVKAVDVLIRALGGVRKIVPKARLFVAGDGPEEQRLRALARDLELEESVYFVGFHQREKLVELYVCGDVFCLPSRHEPWGVVVNEAAACGLPLVVSDRVGAGPDLIEPGCNGSIVRCEDVNALAAALERWLCAGEGDAERVSRDRARQWGYDFAVEQFAALCRATGEHGRGR